MGNIQKSLKAVRALKSLSQWELAKITGIPNYRLSLIENGRIQPTEEEFSQIIDGLGVTEKELQELSEKFIDEKPTAKTA